MAIKRLKQRPMIYGLGCTRDSLGNMKDTYVGLTKGDKEWIRQEADKREDETVSSLIRRLVMQARIRANNGDNPFD